MTLTRSPLSLNTTSTGAQTGRTVMLRKVGGATRFSAQVTLTASTKASFRMQGSLDGVTWTNLGSAASTFSSTSASQTMTSTSTVAFTKVRVNQVSMVTKTAKRSVASITGY